MKNRFYNEIQKAYKNNATYSDLKDLLGRGRAKKGMFDGDLDEGELEIGQVSALIKDNMPVSDIISEIIEDFKLPRKRSSKFVFFNN